MAYWQNFETEVSHLLSLQGWKVGDEQLIRSKKVDLLITKQLFADRAYRIAVECKAYKRKLTKTEVELIFSSYMPLLHNSDVDELLIVSLSGISPAAVTYCKENRSISHTSFAQLESSILNFDLYVQGILTEYSRKGINKYYIDQSVKSLQDDNEAIPFQGYFESWLEQEIPEPIAILGGYGMGKSTLALRLAYLLAENYKLNKDSRIPIIIKLGGLATEQSLEGLLGKHLAAENTVQNYQFDVFMELNKRGRFVIILDGFDEMKKTMSWDDMRFNFQELFRLITPKSKVVICGRPTVFLNEDEYAEIINGKKRIGKILQQIPSSPQFSEMIIQPFTKHQVEEYIQGYSNYLHEENNIKFPENRIKLLIETIKEKSTPLIANLANRPVHLRMLVELLPHINYDYSDSRVSTLYSEFIDYVMRRELEKRVRVRYSAYKRRIFLRSLAWWMWNSGLGEGVSISKIEKRIFAPFLTDEDDFNDIARDLLSGSILDTKNQNIFYFPHRSFLEYLVAEQLAKEIRSGEEISWDTFLTPEIGMYLREILNKDEDFDLLLSVISNYRGVLDGWVINLLVDLSSQPEQLFKSDGVSPWAAVAFFNGIIRGQWKGLSNIEVRDIFVQRIFRYDTYHEESEKYKYLLQFLYLRIKNQLKQRGFNIDKELYSYMKQKYRAVIDGELRIEAATAISGLSRNYCFIESWEKILRKKEFMYSKARINYRSH